MFFIYADDNLIYRPLEADLTIFNPTLTLEMGKAGSLEFEIPEKNIYYKNFNQFKTIVHVDYDDEEIFRGRVLTIERQFDNSKKIYCEGNLAYLIDSVQKGEKYEGTTHALFRKIIAAHNAKVEDSKKFTVGNITIDNRSIKLLGKSDSDEMNVGDIDYRQIAIDSTVDDWVNTFDYIQTTLIDYCGGYLRARTENGVTYIDYLKDYFGNTSQVIELGSNILELTDELSIEDFFTVLIPLGDENLTIKDVNGGSEELVDKNAVAKYGRIVRTHVFNNVNQASTLLENAKRYLAENINTPRTISINAIDLHMINPNIGAIYLGDRAHINSAPHDIDEYLVCTEITYDINDPTNNEYTFGNPKQTLTQRYKEDKRKTTDATSGVGSSSGVGASGWHLRDDVDSETDDKLDTALKDFFDAWINVDKEHATASLGALYKKVENNEYVLTNQVGIDFNAVTGNVNLHSLSTKVDENTSALVQQNSKIELYQKEAETGIKQTTERIVTLGNTVSKNHTEFTQKSNDLEAAINAQAQSIDSVGTRTANLEVRATSLESTVKTQTKNISTNAGEIVKNKTSISQISTQLDSQIKLEASHYSGLTGKVASIEIKANVNASAITLKADQINLESALTRISNLESDSINTGNLQAKISDLSYVSVKLLEADSITIGEHEVGPLEHYHSISEVGGKLYINPGRLTQVASGFSIADTKTYKDGVSAAREAVRVNSIRKNPDQEVRYGKTTKIVYYPVQANTTAYSTFHKDTVLAVPASEIYDAGAESVTLGTIGATWSGNTLSVSCKASNGLKQTRDIDCSSLYNTGKTAGAESVVLRSLGIGSVGNPYASGKSYYVDAQINTTVAGTKGDGTLYTVEGSLTKAVNVTSVFDLGKEAGYDDGFNAVKLNNLVTTFGGLNSRVATIKATTTNGKEKTTTIDCNRYYDSGVASVKLNNLVTEWGGTNSRVATIRASTSNGKEKSTSINCNTYYDLGVSSVTLGSIGATWTGNTVSVSCTASNGARQTRDIDCSSIYSSGKTDGAQTASLTSLSVGSAGASYINDSNGYRYSDVTVTTKVTAIKGDGTAYTVNGSYTKAIRVGTVYTEGVNSVTLGAIGATWSGNTLSVSCRASNNERATRDIDCTSLYNSGKTAGAQTAAIDTITMTPAGSSYVRNGVRYSTTTVTTRVKATKGDGTTYTSTAQTTKEINVGTVYNEGLSAGGASSVEVSQSGGDYDIWIDSVSRDEEYEIYGVRIGVELTNGKTFYQFRYV